MGHYEISQALQKEQLIYGIQVSTTVWSIGALSKKHELMHAQSFIANSTPGLAIQTVC